MAENLRTTKYNDGTDIPHIMDNKVWSNLTSGAYSIYNFSPENEQIYGKLYNWYAVNTGKLCPKGWHIPTDAEWTQLENYLGSNVGGKLKATGNTTDGTGLWESPNSGATNESGFSGLPGGYRGGDGSYGGMGSLGYWWSSTEYGTSLAWGRYLYYSVSSVFRGNDGKERGLSCRCARD
ncbi:MAG: fibrobacter succinogenes major paralogous domain-containing protein [Chitinophagales bacterium]|nr:fibrobacter succinogenes major paralogous domain-containing protein [Chitinophagales bacterium]